MLCVNLSLDFFSVEGSFGMSIVSRVIWIEVVVLPESQKQLKAF